MVVLTVLLAAFKAYHIGHVVVSEMCRNYTCLWPESKLRHRLPHPVAHMSASETKREEVGTW